MISRLSGEGGAATGRAEGKVRWLRRWRWRLLIGLGVLCLLALVAAEVLDAPYLGRLLSYPEDAVGNVDWFEPKEAVPGGPEAVIPSEPAGETEIDPSAIAAAAAELQRRDSSAFLIVHKGRMTAEHYWRGKVARSWNTSMSMAKTLAGLLVGIAIDEGQIASLDEPASRYLPAWANDGRRDITLRHLLQMCSGLREMGEYEDPYSDASYLALGSDTRWVLENVTLAREPGKAHSYNNCNTQALAMVLEKATGQRYAAYLSEKLWKPLGNTDAAVWLDRKGGNARAFGFIFATPRDWARVGLMMMNGGRANGRQVVPEAWIRQMLTPSPMEPDYGLHVWLGNSGGRNLDRKQALLAKDLFWLDGHAKQRVYVVPSKELVIVRTGEQTRKWDESWLVNAIVRGMGERGQ